MDWWSDLKFSHFPRHPDRARSNDSMAALTMMHRDDEYRRNAVRARRSARRARTDGERAAWLILAAGWLGLLKGAQVNDQALDPGVAQRNRRNDSETSH